MTNKISHKVAAKENEYLWPMLKSLPYFRALLRSVEAAFYKDVSLQKPCLDIGCGDGHFAELVFDHAISLGMDPAHASLKEAKGRGSYEMLVQANGDQQPFPSKHFASAISNSVLEHIPQVELVLEESARLLKPGAQLIFCVPNHRWKDNLLISNWLKKLTLNKLAQSYERLFIKISRHVNMFSPKEWESRLNQAGFKLERYWHYFSPRSLHALELGHYFGFPSLISRWLTKRWILFPTKWNLALSYQYLKPFALAEADQRGTYTWLVAKRE